ncbi:MAG: MBL fold metallo-hydrolase [Salibacteraceae bacterium]
MYIEQLYTGCLAEAAYYIESDGVAAIIDPLRETEPYIELAKSRGAKIKYIFETHFHADFVSGHVDLAKKTGATIVYGPTAKTSYDILEAKDEQVFELGSVKLKVLHTPGHTPESSCYLLFDEEGKEHSIYTGDTLFIGDVGRPDLAQKSGEVTAEDLAATLYDSLRAKIMPLPDHITVYPGHGAGSACGKKMSSDTSALLGDQKKTNYALSDISKEDFVKELTTGILPPPQYFAKAAAQNKGGYKSIDEVFEASKVAMTAGQVKAESDNGTLVLDTRHQDDFREGHIPNAWFIGLNGQFAPWAGALIEDLHERIVIVADQGKEEEAIMRLARVGYDNVIGYLSGGMPAWIEAGLPVKTINSISPDDFASNGVGEAKIMDVRKPSEFEEGHLEHAVNNPLDFFVNQVDAVDKNQTYAIHCKGGYRSMIAASILESKGVKGTIDMMGGFDKLKETGAKVVVPALA